MPQATALTVERAFNGPLDSGQGGYSCGLVAGVLGGPAAVTLRRPVPLDTPLTVDAAADGSGGVRLLDGEALIAEGRAEPAFALAVPAPVTLDEARSATAHYRGVTDNEFSRCYVCGRARHDTFGVFAGRVEGRDVVASPWTPPARAADASGRVRDEHVWAALDCPTYFALYAEAPELPLSFLGRMTARVDGDVVAGEEHVVMAWPLEADGRKRPAGAAVLHRDGTVLAVAHALLIEPRA